MRYPLTPVSVSPSAVAADTSNGFAAASEYDEGIRSFAGATDVLTHCYSAAVAPGNLPKELCRAGGPIAGRVWTADASGLPGLVLNDPLFPMKLPNGQTVNQASLDFSAGAKASFIAADPYPTSGAWAVIAIFAGLNAQGAMYTQSGANNLLGGGLSFTASDVRAWATYGTSANGIAVAPRSQMHENGANIIAAFGDPTVKQVGVMLNSKTPQLSTPGVGTWQFNALPQIICNVASGAGPLPIKLCRLALFDASPWHRADCQTKLLDLFGRASRSFGIGLF